jgi:DNA polymerase-3 subunit beta
MKLLCDRQQLQDAFGIVCGVVPAKSPTAILTNVLLSADRDSVTFFATDGEMSARVAIESVKVTKPGKVLLPARETGALLREIADPTVSLEAKESRCHLECSGGTFILLGEDPEVFPHEKQFETVHRLEIPGDKLLDMLRRTTFAVAREESRYAVQGELFEVKDDSFRLVATDGRRLSFCYLNLERDTPPVRAVVPVRILQALMRAIPRGARIQSRSCSRAARSGSSSDARCSSAACWTRRSPTTRT